MLQKYKIQCTHIKIMWWRTHKLAFHLIWELIVGDSVLNCQLIIGNTEPKAKTKTMGKEWINCLKNQCLNSKLIDDYKRHSETP